LATFPLSIDYVVLLRKTGFGLYFGRFFQKHIWSPCGSAEDTASVLGDAICNADRLGVINDAYLRRATFVCSASTHASNTYCNIIFHPSYHYELVDEGLVRQRRIHSYNSYNSDICYDKDEFILTILTTRERGTKSHSRIIKSGEK
jgi:hypothetical protein